MITRLSERHLAALYEQAQVPMFMHTALYAPEGLNEDRQRDLEAQLRHNPPDLALISLGLCAVVLAEYMARHEEFEAEHALVTEMKYLGIESVETFGPPYLGEDIGLIDIEELLSLCPIQLCALGSLFEDLAGIYPFAGILSAIAYDQADKAEAMLAGEVVPEIEKTAQTQTIDTSNVVSLDLFTAWRKDKEPAE